MSADTRSNDVVSFESHLGHNNGCVSIALCLFGRRYRLTRPTASVCNGTFVENRPSLRCRAVGSRIIHRVWDSLSVHFLTLFRLVRGICRRLQSIFLGGKSFRIGFHFFYTSTADFHFFRHPKVGFRAYNSIIFGIRQ